MMAPTAAAKLMVPAIVLLLLSAWLQATSAFVSTSCFSAISSRNQHVTTEGRLHRQHQPRHRCCGQRAKGFADTKLEMTAQSVVDVKSKVLQLAAVMDRGGMANPGKRRVYCCCQVVMFVYSSIVVDDRERQDLVGSDGDGQAG